MQPTIAELAHAAALCNAAYIEDASAVKTAFAILDETFVGQYKSADHQAVLSIGADGTWGLTHAGTRASDFKVPDLLDDIDLMPVDIGGGVTLPRGPWNGMGDLWQWVHATAPATAALKVRGHSLGAARTAYTPEFLPPERIVSLIAIESPKFYSAEYWRKHAAQDGLSFVVNRRDLWVSWPFVSHWVERPTSFLWLTDDGLKTDTPATWPGGRSAADHDIGTIADNLSALEG